MSVDPLKSNNLPKAASTLQGNPAQRAAAAGGTEPEKAAATDSVELSEASRSLVDQADSGTAVPQGTLSSERLQEVLRRLNSEFYDSPEVRQHIAHRVQSDLGHSTTE